MALSQRQLRQIEKSPVAFIEAFRQPPESFTTDRLRAIEIYANALMFHFGVHWFIFRRMHPGGAHHFSFKFSSKMSRTLGICDYTNRQIRLSTNIATHAPWEQIDDTIRHEIAHVLAGHAAGHGPEWKRVARICGANPRSCAHVDPEHNPSKYLFVIIHDCGSLEVLEDVRGPSKKIRLDYRYIKKQKQRTLDRLGLISRDDYKAGRVSHSRLAAKAKGAPSAKGVK